MIYRGKLTAFDSGTYKATVRLDGSAAQTLSGIATSRAIPSAEMTTGRKVLVDTGDHNDPADIVLTAIWT